LSSNKKYGNDIDKKRIDKKGIIVTLFIAIGIIGASFIVWFLPQENNNNNNNNAMLFSNPNDTLTAVNNQFVLLKTELNNQIQGSESPQNHFNTTQLKNSINAFMVQNNELMQTLLHGNPSGSMVPSYVNLMNSLKNFSFYLGDLKNIAAISNSPVNITNDLTALQKKWSIK
jgi:hypothetical protein